MPEANTNTAPDANANNSANTNTPDGGNVQQPTNQQPDNEGGNNNSHDFDNQSWDEKTRSYIQSLRQENARYRTKAKDLGDQVGQLSTRQEQFEQGIKKALGLEGNDMTPEQTIEVMGAQNEELGLRNEILGTAIEHGIDKSGLKYFEFLLNDRLGEMEEGDELTEDDLASIAQEVKGKYSANNMGNGNTSVTTSGNNMPNPNTSPQVTIDQFSAMSITEKSKLFQENPDLYNSLTKQARQKGVFIPQSQYA